MSCLLRSLSPLASLALPLLFGALLAGCQTMSPQTRSASDEWRMASLEENFLEFKEAQQAERKRLDETAERLQERMMALEEQMAALRKEMGEVDRAAAGLDAASESPVMAGPVSGEERPWAEGPGEQPPAPAEPAPKPAPKPAPQPAQHKPVTTQPAPAKASSAQSLYDLGFRQVDSGKNEDARKTFDQFLKQYPKHALVPNALYWKGETYYAEKDYPRAILAFKEVTGRYPKHAKAQAALLKIGMSYRNAGDVDNAVFYLRTLVDEHPGSEPANLAARILKELPE